MTTIEPFVKQHLMNWCNDQFSFGAATLYTRMLEHLCGLDADEYAHALEGGWWKLYDGLPKADTTARYRARFDERGLQCGLECTN